MVTSLLSLLDTLLLGEVKIINERKEVLVTHFQLREWEVKTVVNRNCSPGWRFFSTLTIFR